MLSWHNKGWQKFDMFSRTKIVNYANQWGLDGVENEEPSSFDYVLW